MDRHFGPQLRYYSVRKPKKSWEVWKGHRVIFGVTMVGFILLIDNAEKKKKKAAGKKILLSVKSFTVVFGDQCHIQLGNIVPLVSEGSCLLPCISLWATYVFSMKFFSLASLDHLSGTGIPWVELASLCHIIEHCCAKRVWGLLSAKVWTEQHFCIQ